MFSGAFAGVFEGLLVHLPVENMKVKIIHDKVMAKPRYKGVFDGIYKICKERGFKGVTRGAVPTVIKEASNNGFRFPVFLTW
jgi:solute carrier family 25 citrate transporter 1